MDLDLRLLAEASLAVERAEGAVGEGAFVAARDALDEAERALADVRARWPAMGGAERAVVGRAGAPVRERVDALGRRLAAAERATRVAGATYGRKFERS